MMATYKGEGGDGFRVLLIKLWRRNLLLLVLVETKLVL